MRAPGPPEWAGRGLVLLVLKDLGHVRLHKFDPVELLCVTDLSKRAERHPVLPFWRMGTQGALCGIVRFTGKQQFDPTEFLSVPVPLKRAGRGRVLLF